jgi:hypothetical protein
VNTENAGHALVERGLHRGDRASDGVHVVADQRRQKTGRAEAPVRRAYRADRFGIRIVVEQYPAAAVDLHVDEAGEQQPPFEIHDERVGAARIVGIDERFDVPGRQQQRLAAHQPRSGQQAAVHECGAHYTVSVILLRCAGRSGSNPRRIASDAINR